MSTKMGGNMESASIYPDNRMIYRERDLSRRQFSIRIGAELLEKIRAEARRLRTSPSIFIEDALIDKISSAVKVEE